MNFQIYIWRQIKVYVYRMVRLRRFLYNEADAAPRWQQYSIVVGKPQKLVPHTPQKTLTYQNVTYTLYQLFKITEIDNFFTAAKSLTLFTVIYSYLSNFIKGGGPAKKLQTIKTHSHVKT